MQRYASHSQNIPATERKQLEITIGQKREALEKIDKGIKHYQKNISKREEKHPHWARARLGVAQIHAKLDNWWRGLETKTKAWAERVVRKPSNPSAGVDKLLWDELHEDWLEKRVRFR